MLKFGIIGTGKICQGCHLPAYDRMDNVEIVALCDINEERVKEVGKKYPNARLYTEYKEIIEK